MSYFKPRCERSQKREEKWNQYLGAAGDPGGRRGRNNTSPSKPSRERRVCVRGERKECVEKSALGVDEVPYLSGGLGRRGRNRLN